MAKHRKPDIEMTDKQLWTIALIALMVVFALILIAF